MLTLKQLRYAVALAKHGSFHRAASAENISQPALSRSISALEAELAVCLFNRQATPVVPTAFGEALLSRARLMLEETQQIQREVQYLQDLQVGSLSIAMGVYAAEMSAARAVGQLVADYPNIDCRLRLTSWSDLLPLLNAGRVDLAIGEISTLKNSERFVIKPIGNHDLVFFCRPEHPLAGLSQVTDVEMADYPSAMVRIPPRAARLFPGRNRLDEETGNLRPSIEVDDLATARTIVSHSDAFGMATPLQISPWLENGTFRVLRYFKPWMKLSYGFIFRQDRMLSPTANKFVSLMLAIESEVQTRNREMVEDIKTGLTERCRPA